MNVLRWSMGPVQFVSPPDLSTTFVVCQACGFRADMQKVFPTLMETRAVAEGHLLQHNGAVPVR